VTKPAEGEVEPTDALGEADARTSRTSDTSALNSRVGPESAPNQKRELASNTSGCKASPSRTRTTLLTSALALVTLLLAVLAFVHFREQVPTQQTVRFSIMLPDKSRPLSLAVSPNGRVIAMVLVKDGRQQIWVRPLDAFEPTALAGTDGAADPFWSPDGHYVAYDKVGVGIFRKPANGAGGEELLVPAKILAIPKSWSPDGRFILYAQINPGTGADLLGISVEPNAQPFVVAQTPGTEDQGQFSPDGHWVAYTSNESGLSEIDVVPFPPSSSGGKWLVSRGGGVQPRWRRNGKELFYISPDSKMMAVEVSTQPVFQSGTPQPLFQTDIVDTGSVARLLTY
jgi:dipeptidyl aminopeptidase/acylaminoacyl peptidase